MPPGYGNGKPPSTSRQELSEDPIEIDPDVDFAQSTMKTNQIFTIFQRPEKSIPSSFESYADPGTEEIPIPFGDMNHTRGVHNNILSGPFGPVKRLHSITTYGSPANSSRSRKRSYEQAEFEKIKPDNVRQSKLSKVMEAPSTISSDEEDHLQQAAQIGGGHKKTQQNPRNIKAGNVSDRMNVSSDDIDESRSLHFPPRFVNEHLQVVISKDSNSSSSSNKWSDSNSRWSNASVVQTHKSGARPVLKTKAKSKGRPLLSVKGNNKKKFSWPLVTFQRGILQLDSEDKPLRLEILEGSGVCKIFLGDEECEEAEFSCSKLRNVMFCKEDRSFGLTFYSSSALAVNGFFVLKDSLDVAAASKIFTGYLTITPTEPNRMKQHCNSLQTLQDTVSRVGNVPLVDDPTETRRLEEQKHRDSARRALEEEGRKHSRAKSNQTKHLAETQPTRTTRSRKTASVGIARSIPMDDSDHRETLSEDFQKLDLPPPWKQPLLYPFEGSKRANVDYEDLNRLSPTEFLNDNIINFYLRHIEENLRHKNPLLHQETHFFNTFFYERLSMKGDKQRNMEGVLKWTAKIDLFKKNYVIVPINESSHWYLAIICNLQHLERKLQKDPAVDSEATVSSETDPIDNSSSPGPSSHQQAVFDLDAHPDKMEIVNDNHNIPETQNGLQNMSVDEDEWPEPDENESRDRTLEDRNKQIKLGKVSNDPIDIEMVDAESPSRNTSAKSKPPRKSAHFQSPDDPAIIILDSMAVKRNTTIAKLKDWLIFEARHKRSLEIPKDTLKGAHPKAPSQDNWHDCGLYMLHYIEIFLEHREKLVSSFLARDNNVEPEIWRDNDIKGMRTRLFDLICKLQKEYDALHPVKTTSKARTDAQPPAKAKASPGSIDNDTASKVPSPQRTESPGMQIILEANDAMRTADSATTMDYQLNNGEAEQVAHDRVANQLESNENDHIKNDQVGHKAKPRIEKRHSIEVTETDEDDDVDMIQMDESVDMIEVTVPDLKLKSKSPEKSWPKSTTQPSGSPGL